MDFGKCNKIWRVNLTTDFQPILDYVEGRMSVTEFQHLFMTNKALRRILKIHIRKDYDFLSDYHYNLFEYLSDEYDFKNKTWDCISMRSGLQYVLCVFLDNFGIEYVRCQKYRNDYSFLLDIQPDWLDVLDDSILQPIIDSIPKDLSKTKRIAMGKEKIRALFKYDKTYPRWVQSPEWPIVNGKPLVFSHQEKAKGGDIRTYYYFYDEDTKEQTVIEQFD